MKCFLPHRFLLPHRFSLFLHAILSRVITEGEAAGLFDSEFDIKNKSDLSHLEKLSNEEYSEWMLKNGYESELLQVFYKQVSVRLLSDFCHYIHTTLVASAAGKISVAYTLLRKPFKDNLLLLEWLVAAPEEFLVVFSIGETREYDPSALNSNKKQEIIKKALETVKKRNSNLPFLYKSDFLYEIRYEREREMGLEKFWNPATHLVTNAKGYATQKMNFNFIFQQEEETNRCWEHIYSYVPFLLNYAVEIIENLISNLGRRKNEHLDLTDIRREIGFALWIDKISSFKENEFSSHLNSSFLKPYLDLKINFHCVQCLASSITLHKNRLEKFYRLGLIQCPNCGMNNSLLMDLTKDY